MAVQQHVLNWLYSVLTSVRWPHGESERWFPSCGEGELDPPVNLNEYHDVNRTYNDVAQALSQYASLSPRTDVHTFPNGVSALLLHLSGTIPVQFRGTTYRFPISLWVPHAYPREPPLVYVTPTDDMVVRPGQHVDPQGQVYHPYLVGWSGFWDKSTILDFLAILRDVFAKEPPVVAKQQQARTPVRQHPVATPPPVPPLPPDMARPASASLGQTYSPAPDPPRPPPPPPKGSDPPIHRPFPVPPQTNPAGPPLPPHPTQQHDHGLSELGAATPSPPHAPRSGHKLSRYDSAPPLPPQHDASARAFPQGGAPPPQQYQQRTPAPQAYPSQQQDSRRASFSPSHHYGAPPSPAAAAAQNWQHHQQLQRAPQQLQLQHQPLPLQHPQRPQQPQQRPLPQPHPQTFEAPGHPQPSAMALGHARTQVQTRPAVQKKPSPPDLMDEPLVIPVPPPSNVPAPPIPPNPEKDALLHQLAQTLHAMRQRSRAQNEATMSGLQAQRTAMLNALALLQAEASGLSQLSALLGSNTNILRDALRRADAVIADSRARQQQGSSASGAVASSAASAPGLPDVDELLVAPTVVANQLYDLVAEERALADAVFVLGRAVERGRISPAVFAKTTRSLSREWFLKKALVRKIGRGMGLIAQ